MERRKGGTRPEQDCEIAIPAGEGSQRELPSPWEEYVLKILERVRASAPRALGDLGFGRWIELRLI